ncbi:Cytochrome P450 [Dillenia turbinata]|uniref:Cytochrome P450 n=1 Tax=Dillenia turbinata TaxID=194707 RepID=A0AAN8YZ94_9MAGN
MLQSLSYSLISRVVFGRKYKGEDGKAGFESLARNVMKLLVAFSFGDLYPSLSWLDSVTGLTRSYNKTFSALDALFDQIIKEHQFAKMEDDQNEKEDFIDILLRIQKEGMLDVHLTQDNIKAIMLKNPRPDFSSHERLRTDLRIHHLTLGHGHDWMD